MNYDSAKADILSETPVKSVNGKTGEITLNASDVGAATSNHGHADLMEAINKRFYHAGLDFSHYTTVNEAVNACTVDTSFFSVDGTNLLNASDSPFPKCETQYFVMVDHNARRTVFAICYGNGRMATNSTFNKGAFICNPWLEPYSSQNKPTYSDVGAASATHGHSNLDTLWKRWNSHTNVNHCTDIDNPVYNGMYHCNDTGTAGSKPSAHGELLHITENPVWSEHQMYFPSSGKIYHRQRNNNGTANSKAWPSWERVMTSGCFSLSGTTLTITTT
jgi:hypothetical protein